MIFFFICFTHWFSFTWQYVRIKRINTNLDKWRKSQKSFFFLSFPKKTKLKVVIIDSVFFNLFRSLKLTNSSAFFRLSQIRHIFLYFFRRINVHRLKCQWFHFQCFFIWSIYNFFWLFDWKLIDWKFGG